MAAVVILNIVLAIFIVAAILSLLGWGIATDGARSASRSGRARTAARVRPTRPSRERLGRAADHAA